jgi:hypothetical protein
MSYTLNMSVSAELDKETVENILKEFLERDTGRKVKKIEFNLAMIFEFADYDSYKIFSGCTVQFEDDKKTVGSGINLTYPPGVR